jgi:hypothetical protein
MMTWCGVGAWDDGVQNVLELSCVGSHMCMGSLSTVLGMGGGTEAMGGGSMGTRVGGTSPRSK